VQNVVVSKDI